MSKYDEYKKAESDYCDWLVIYEKIKNYLNELKEKKDRLYNEAVEEAHREAKNETGTD